jgi:Phage capsid family
MDDIQSTLGLLRREVRDARAIASNVDHKLTRLIENGDGSRDGSLVVRLAACRVLARTERTTPAAIAADRWPHDIQLKTATGPALSSQSGWASELIATVIVDIADRLLAPSVFSQLRDRGLALDFIDGAVTRVPGVQPVASGSFVAEGAAINVGALLITAASLPAKKAASIIAVTKELLRGSAASVEASLQAIMSEDLSLAIDAILLDATAADAIRPAGLRAGVSGLTPSATGTPTEKMMADVKALLNGIAPSIRPTLIAGTTPSASLSILGPQLGVPVIPAPQLTGGTVIMLDAAAFASIVGTIEINTTEEAVIHMSDAALPLVGGTVQPPVIGSVAAPQQSLFQTASVGMRSILNINWTLRRSGAVAWMTGVGW